MKTDAQAELAKLREQLRLCQLELASARRQLEEEAESRTLGNLTKQRLRELTTRLDERLQKAESTAGRRGQLKRKLISSMPRKHEDADLAVLRASSFMNGPWYLQKYPEVASTGLSPALHYLRHGAADQKDPGPLFSTHKYLLQHPELPTGVNPLVHFHATKPESQL